MAVKLEDYLPVPRSVLITGSDKVLMVRGLTLQEIVKLIAKYKDDIAVFLDPNNTRIDQLVISAPPMAAEIICLAADAEGQEEQAKKFPFAVQVNALTAIWELSVPDLKKLAESFGGLIAATRKINAESLIPQ